MVVSNSSELTHLSLFSGIGGIDLAAEWVGFKTVAFVERDQYCRKVLAKRWPGVPIIEDVHNATAITLGEWGIRPGGVTLLSGGFPCQPYSHAGKRMGNEDDRAIWPQMLRLIREFKPRWVCAENVTGLITMALDGVLSDLAEAGYETGTVVLPACAVQAPHIRKRVFIIANANGCARGASGAQIPQQEKGPTKTTGSRSTVLAHAHSERQLQPAGAIQQIRRWVSNGNQALDVADPERQGLAFGEGAQRERTRPAVTGGNWWAVEPDVGRMAHGIPSRVDRLRALGNAVVPQQIYPVLKAIAECEGARAA